MRLSDYERYKDRETVRITSITLYPRQRKWIKEQVQKGRYENRSHAVRKLLDEAMKNEV